jgi:hypothetical protein
MGWALNAFANDDYYSHLPWHSSHRSCTAVRRSGDEDCTRCIHCLRCENELASQVVGEWIVFVNSNNGPVAKALESRTGIAGLGSNNTPRQELIRMVNNSYFLVNTLMTLIDLR